MHLLEIAPELTFATLNLSSAYVNRARKGDCSFEIRLQEIFVGQVQAIRWVQF